MMGVVVVAVVEVVFSFHSHFPLMMLAGREREKREKNWKEIAIKWKYLCAPCYLYAWFSVGI